MSCHDPPGSGRPGFTVVEGLVALVVSAILVAGVASTIVTASRLERTAADRAEALASGSLAATVLGHELRATEPAGDGLALEPDSVGLRAFRGTGIVCAADSLSADLRYRGIRAPDATKDSLLVLTGAVPERAAPLASTSTSTVCILAPGESGVTVRPGAGMIPGDIVLVFERGAYHLAGGALRYRRGAGGRQPLTAGTFLDDSTDLDLVSGYGVGASQPETVAIRLRVTPAGNNASPVGRPTIRYVPLRNLPAPLDSLVRP